MAEVGLNHVALGVDVHMPDLAVPELKLGSVDDGIRRTIRTIRDAGSLAVLVPRIESPAFFKPPYPFRADIAFGTQGEWDRFFASLEKVLVHYAQLCESEGVSGLGLGLEMLQAVQPRHEAAWRRLIAKVRAHFNGWLTYSANWYQEYEQVPFWDALDVIGIGAYFEVVPDERAGLADAQEIAAGWARVFDRLADFSEAQGRPILFTEIGYPGYVHGPARPWKWAGVPEGTPVDLVRQGIAYEGFLAAARGRPWFRGFLLWRFHTSTQGIFPWEYALRGRPAADVIRAALKR